MRKAALCFAFATACSSSGQASGDDDQGSTVDAAGPGSNATFTDPEWPVDAPLPPEFDFPPYLTMPKANTIVVSWRTNAMTTGTVSFGPTPAMGMQLPSSTAVNVHHVTLENLAPRTAYYYEVKIDGTSAVRSGVFVTPGAAKWRFLHLGEFHAPRESEGVAKYVSQIRNFRPHVIIDSGDMVDIGEDLTQWRSYLRQSAPWISNVILLPSHSNHVNGNGGNNHLKSLFVLPNNERWYTTRYGQVQVISIDSTYDANDDVASTEVPWIRAEAAAAHDGVDDPTFLIAAWHYPACSSQYLTRASQRSWVQLNLVRAFKDNGSVDLILVGHDKYYERDTIAGGIIHVMTNIGNISPEIPGQNHGDCTVEKSLRNTRSAAFFSVDGNKLSASVTDEAGAVIDTFSITK